VLVDVGWLNSSCGGRIYDVELGDWYYGIGPMVRLSMGDPLRVTGLAISDGVRRASMGEEKGGVIGDHHLFYF